MYLQNKFLKRICLVWSGRERPVLVINPDMVREFRRGLFKSVLSRDFLHLHKKCLFRQAGISESYNTVKRKTSSGLQGELECSRHKQHMV